jgi:RNA polymerase sigma factor (TIGR02999 family)
LIHESEQNWEHRLHFLSLAAQVIRRVLVDHARARAADKRSGKFAQEEHPTTIALDDRGFDLLALHEALEKLADLDERQSHVVELRFFAGLSVEETAKVLATSQATVKRDWEMARAFLYRELTPS